MNNDTLANLEINLKKIENSKLMNTDFQNISSVDIDTLKKENEFLKSRLNGINNGNRNFNQRKKFNNYMHSPNQSLQSNPNDTFNNNICKYGPYNNNNNNFNNQNYNSNNSFNPNNNFNNQMYNANLFQTVILIIKTITQTIHFIQLIITIQITKLCRINI